MTEVQGGKPFPVAVIAFDDSAILQVEQYSYSTVRSGELAGATTATQMPNIPCRMVKFKARNDNAGNIYVGGAGVTKPDGFTDTTTGLELDAAEETGWIMVDNLNRLYYICDNVGDDLVYLALV